MNPKNSILNQSDIVHTNVMSVFPRTTCISGLLEDNSSISKDFFHLVNHMLFFFKVGKGTKDPSEGRTIHSIGNITCTLL